jgi:myo-inositol-1(or 4)-monophosphatase
LSKDEDHRKNEMPYLSPALNVMVSAARKAGRGLIRDFGEIENLQVSLKGPGDFVSTADKRTENQLLEELSRARPGYCFLMEEGGAVDGPDKSHRFIIDPIDGTTNFLHGIPHFAISIGLEREGQLVSAVVFNPVTDEMYVAEKGQGAFLNDKRLRVAARKKLNESILATGIPWQTRGDHPMFLAELAAAMGQTAGVRRFGTASLDLAYVAAGRFDGYWERGLLPWDMAAGILLVREAGGVVTDLDGGTRSLENGHILAANEPLHPQVLKLLKDAGRAAKG